MTGSEVALEGRLGFCGLFSGGRVSGIGPHDEDLGRLWHIVSPGLSLKAYPCCRSTHSAIDAAIALRERVGGIPDGIVKIVCRTSPHHTKLARFHDPKSPYEAKFSIRYCIASALLRGTVTLDDFTEERAASPVVRSLLSKVEFDYPDEYLKDPMGLTQEVVITLADGSEHACIIRMPKGDSDNPMSREDVVTKFRGCAGACLSADATAHVLEIVDHLESEQDISRLSRLLTYPGTAR
jgi:2-methylcitrate dehydratase PrpD